jgi:hypothetical protein
MRYVSLLFGTSVAASLVGSACTERAEDPAPEHRIKPCEDWCSAVVDPQCGSPDAATLDYDDCVEDCVSGDWNWAPQPDGEDRCAPQQIAYVDCVVGLECDDRARLFRDDSAVINESLPCAASMEAMFACVQESR